MKKKKYEYKQVKVNFSLDDYAELEKLATDLQLTKAEVLRNSVGTTLEKVRKPAPQKTHIKEIKVDAKWRYEINKIGVNLNQAVEAMHTSKSVIELKALSYIIEQIDTLDNKITEYIMSKK